MTSIKTFIIFISFFISFVCCTNADVNQWYTNQTISSPQLQEVYLVPIKEEQKHEGLLFQAYTHLQSVEEGKYLCVQVFNPVQVANNTWSCTDSPSADVYACIGHFELSVWGAIDEVTVSTCCSDSSSDCTGTCDSGVTYDIYFQFFNGNNATTECGNVIPEHPDNTGDDSSPSSEEGGMGFWAWFFIVLGSLVGLAVVVAIVLAVGYFIYRKKRSYNEF